MPAQPTTSTTSRYGASAGIPSGLGMTSGYGYPARGAVIRNRLCTVAAVIDRQPSQSAGRQCREGSRPSGEYSGSTIVSASPHTAQPSCIGTRNQPARASSPPAAARNISAPDTSLIPAARPPAHMSQAMFSRGL